MATTKCFCTCHIATMNTRHVEACCDEDNETATCPCRRCLEEDGFDTFHMIVCEKCGNKRCPHANDHRNECTGSNELGQPGSAYL
jgi:hypothetical protein